jgi:hypothetical protein
LLVVECEFDVDDGGSGGMNPPCTRAWWIVSGVDGSKDDRKLEFWSVIGIIEYDRLWIWEN